MRPLVIGFTAFVLAFVGLSILMPAQCADGWQSPSIGRRGACSWHGGVTHGSELFAFFLSGVAGLVVALLASRVGKAFVKQTDSELLRNGTAHQHAPTGSLPSEEVLRQRRQLDHERGEELAAFSRIADTVPARSRKPWECTKCHRVHASGSTYWYRQSGYRRDTVRIKYCDSCKTAALDKVRSIQYRHGHSTLSEE